MALLWPVKKAGKIKAAGLLRQNISPTLSFAGMGGMEWACLSFAGMGVWNGLVHYTCFFVLKSMKVS